MGVQKRRGHGNEQRTKGAHHQVLHVDEDRCLCEASASPALSIGDKNS